MRENVKATNGMINFAAISNYSRPLAKVLRMSLKVLPRTMAVPIMQGPLRGKKWIVGSSDHGCWLGSYEFKKQKLFQQMVTRGSVIFDVGANVGFYTLLSSVLTGSEGRVYAFEPLPANAALLRRHVEMNGIRNAVVEELAVSDTCGSAFFEIHPSNAMGKLAESGTLKVKKASLDELVNNGELKPPDVIKIDVEGEELGVLRGAGQVLARFHPKLFLATHGPGVHQDCCEFLTGMGYRLTPIGHENLGESDELLAE